MPSHTPVPTTSSDSLETSADMTSTADNQIATQVDVFSSTDVNDEDDDVNDINHSGATKDKPFGWISVTVGIMLLRESYGLMFAAMGMWTYT